MEENQSSTSPKLQLLAEGNTGCYVPEVAYVRQGNKVAFAWGGSNQLHESLSADTQIVEDIETLEMIERTAVDGKVVKTVKDGVWIVEGPFQRSDTKNANGRVYPRSLWERLIADPQSEVQTCVKARAMVGHVEHPADGRSHGKEGALLVSELKMNKDGVVWGRAELLDTPAGLVLQEYTRKKVRWGVSSRGNGEVGADGMVNEKNFKLTTFDAVLNPSTPGAFPKPIGVVENAPAAIDNLSMNESKGDEETPSHAQAAVAEAMSFAHTLHESLDSGARTKLIANLLKSFGTINGMGLSKALPPTQTLETQNWLIKKLKALSGELAPVPAAPVTESTDAHRQGALERALVKARQERDEALQEAEDLRKQFGVASAAKQIVQAKLKIAENTATKATKERKSAIVELKTAKAKLAKATDLIDSLTEDSTNEEVLTAVDEAVQSHPVLIEHRDVLENASSAEHVSQLAETLCAVREEIPPVPGKSEGFRPSLPRSMVVSEAVLPAKTVVSKQNNQRANLAAQAVARINK